MLKLKWQALRDDVAAGRRCTSKSVSCVKPPPPPAWIMQPPPDWQTPLNGIISVPRERGWSLCKNNWSELKYINECVGQSCPLSDGQLMQLLWAIHTRFQREYGYSLKDKPSNPFTNVCWVSVFNNTFCAATNFGCIDSFLRPPQKRRNDGDGFLGATAAGLFWTVNVCWAHPVISRAS